VRDLGGRSPEKGEKITVRRAVRKYVRPDGTVTFDSGGWGHHGINYVWREYEELPIGELVEFEIQGLDSVSEIIDEACMRAFRNLTKRSSTHGKLIIKARRELGEVGIREEGGAEFNVIVTGELEHE